MSCYFSGLKDVFAEAGIEVVPTNRKRIDLAIRRLVGSEHDHCPETWQKLKTQILGDEQKRKDFVIKLRAAIK